jgi:fatty acid desaturase
MSDTSAAARADTGSPSVARQVARFVDRTELQALSRRTNRHGLGLFAVHVAALAAGGVWVWAARGSVWLVPAVAAYGMVMAHLFALLHEASHRTPFRSPALNELAAHLSGFVIVLPAGYFRLEHVAHHQNTQDAERDPELVVVPPSLARYAAFVIGGPYWWYVVRTTFAHAAGRVLAFERSFLPARVRPKIVREARVYLAGYVVVVVAALWLGWGAALVWLWIVPRLAGEPWMRIARLSEHAGRPRSRDITENTRSLARVPRPLRLLAWNMPYHAEHHAAPGVPFHALARLHRRLEPHLVGHEGGYLAAQGEIVRQIG